MKRQTQVAAAGRWGRAWGATKERGRDAMKERKGLVAVVAAAIVVVIVVGVYLTMFLTSSP